jgi:hypothetical protein
MPLGPLGVTAVLAALDWGAWDWAANSSHPTIGMIAGLLMAPTAVAFAWSLIRVVLALARIALVRAGAQAPQPAPRIRIGSRTTARPFDIEAQEDRLAA